MAGRKVFTSGEILTAADVNSFLMDQSVMVFADSTARSSAIPTPSEGMVTYREDANRVEVYDGSAFGAIGGILQVVQAVKSDTFVTASTTFGDVPDLSVSIAPTSSDSKVLVLTNVKISSTTNAHVAFIRLLRDATPIFLGDGAGSRDNTVQSSFGAATFTQLVSAQNSVFLDSPNTVSSVVYKIQMKATGATGFVNRPAAATDTATFPRTASSIIAMEVAG